MEGWVGKTPVVRLSLWLVGVTLTVSGCLGGSSGTPSEGTSTVPAGGGGVVARVVPLARVELPITGGTSRERAAVHRILAGMGAVGITSVRLGGPQGGYRQQGVWFYLTVAARGQGDAAVEPEWQAMMVASAYRDVAAETGLPSAGGWALTMHLPDGGRVHGAGGSGLIDNHLRSGMFTSPAQVTQRVATIARHTGFRVASVRLLRPWRYLPEVTLIATNPATFAHDYRLAQLHLLGDALVRIQTRCGTPITTNAGSQELQWFTSTDNPHWLCPNPMASLPTPCPVHATKPC